MAKIDEELRAIPPKFGLDSFHSQDPSKMRSGMKELDKIQELQEQKKAIDATNPNKKRIMAEELKKKEEQIKRKEEEAEKKRKAMEANKQTKTKSEMLLEAKKYDQQRRKKPVGNEDLDDPELVAPALPSNTKLSFERQTLEKERKRLLREAEEEDRRRELELERELKEAGKDLKYEKKDAQWGSQGGKLGPTRDQYLEKEKARQAKKADIDSERAQENQELQRKLTKSLERQKTQAELVNDRKKYEQHQRELAKAGQFNQSLPVKTQKRPVSSDEPDWQKKQREEAQQIINRKKYEESQREQKPVPVVTKKRPFSSDEPDKRQQQKHAAEMALYRKKYDQYQRDLAKAKLAKQPLPEPPTPPGDGKKRRHQSNAEMNSKEPDWIRQQREQAPKIEDPKRQKTASHVIKKRDPEEVKAELEALRAKRKSNQKAEPKKKAKSGERGAQDCGDFEEAEADVGDQCLAPGAGKPVEKAKEETQKLYVGGTFVGYVKAKDVKKAEENLKKKRECPKSNLSSGARLMPDQQTFLEQEKVKEEKRSARQQEELALRFTRMSQIGMERDPDFQNKPNRQWESRGAPKAVPREQFLEREQQLQEIAREKMLRDEEARHRGTSASHPVLPKSERQQKGKEYYDSFIRKKANGEEDACYKPNLKPYKYQYDPNDPERQDPLAGKCAVQWPNREDFLKQEEQRKKREAVKKENNDFMRFPPEPSKKYSRQQLIARSKQYNRQLAEKQREQRGGANLPHSQSQKQVTYDYSSDDATAPDWQTGGRMGPSFDQVQRREQELKERKLRKWQEEENKRKWVELNQKDINKTRSELMQDSRDYSKSLDRSRSKSRSISREAAPRPKPGNIGNFNLEEELNHIGGQSHPSRLKPQRPQTAKPVQQQKKQKVPTFKMKYQDDFEEDPSEVGDQCVPNQPQRAAVKSKKKPVEADDFEEEPEAVGDQHVRPQTAKPKQLKPLTHQRQPKPAFHAGPTDADDFEEEDLGVGDQNIGPNVAKAAVEPYVIKQKQPLYKSPTNVAPYEKPVKKNQLKEADLEKMKQNEMKASNQFGALMQEKKNKEKQGNAFMDLQLMEMQKKMKIQKEASKKEQLNPLLKGVQPREKFKGKPLLAVQTYDKEAFDKQIADLKSQIQQVFFENKEIINKTNTFQKESRKQQLHFDTLCKEKNIEMQGGVLLQKVHFKPPRQKLNNDDIPDYAKIEKKENHLENLARKLAERGKDVHAAFDLFDEDFDGVLTLQEIKDGFLSLKIRLTEDELRTLHAQIDMDCDGTCTREEFIQMLDPRFAAQNKYFEIMGELDIDDPLTLEERILDLQFRKRHLEKEVVLMRKQRKDQAVFLSKQKNEMQQVGKKIKEMEVKVKDQQNQPKQTVDFTQELKGKTKQELLEEQELLAVVLAEMEIQHTEQKQRQEQEISALDGRLKAIGEFTDGVSSDKQIKAIQLKAMKKQLEQRREDEAKLDKELEAVLGKAVSMKDLEMLYQQDLKLLNQIESGFNNKIQGFKQTIAALWVQRIWRGHLSRKQFMVVNKVKEVGEDRGSKTPSKYKDLGKDFKNKEVKAALLILNAFRRYKWRKNEVRRITRRNDERRFRSEQEKQRIKEAAVFRELFLIKKIQRWVRARNEARKQGTVATNPFLSSFRSSNNDGSPDRINEIINKGRNVVKLDQDATCKQCSRNIAEIQCDDCQGPMLMCKRCFVKTHSTGTRRRHNSRQISYSHKMNDSFTRSLSPAQ